MKRIEFVLCLFFISTVSFAQKEIAPTKNLDAYIGTWMYQSNEILFGTWTKKRELKIFLSGLQTMLPVWTTLILIESEFYFTTNGRSTSAEKGY